MADVRRKARLRAAPAESGERAHEYRRNAGTRVWSRREFAGIAYSDGDEAERDLLALLKRARDVSTSSDELNIAIQDWVREAHLSPARCNLLRPLDFSRHRRVLELGAGCGAITRYLGEQGLEVDAVEGSLARAECVAERCRDLENVRVFADQITSFRADRRYDVVTLIGVLEYSRLFIESDDPVRSCLETARSHLADGGVLILAIENQLGLKYFNGCAEDHLGAAYSGLTDLYSLKTAVTFGKLELEAKLRASGFGHVDWSFPFPDYKLPTTVISARGLADREFIAGDMLLGEFARDYGGSILRSFDESSVWSALERNGLLGDLANSFLVVASLAQDNPLDDGAWLAYRYSPQRLKPFAAQTRFARRHGGDIIVTKQVVDRPAEGTPVGIDGDFRVEQRLGDQPYVRGRLLARDFMDAVARGYSARDLGQFLKPWIDYLAAHALGSPADGLSTLRIPGKYLDCIPTNLIVDGRGRAHPIDLEFVVPGDIPLPWVVLRGTVHLASKGFGHRELGRSSFRAFLDEILPALGFGDVNDWTPYCDLEDSLIRAVLRPWKGRPAHDILWGRLQLPICVAKSLPESYRLLQSAAQARLVDPASLERSQALVADFARWIGMLPDPRSTTAEEQEARAVPQGLLELSERIATELELATGEKFQERVRELVTQRSRWAWLARDNLRLAWELNDAQARLEASRSELAGREGGATVPAQDEAPMPAGWTDVGPSEALTSEVFELRIERNALKWEVDDTKARLEAARSELAARELALSESTGRERVLAQSAEQLRSELAERDVALRESAQRELELARARGREEGRAEALKAEVATSREERSALRAEIATVKAQLDAALQRLRRRGAELARVHRQLRESNERDEARRRALRAVGPLAAPLRRLQELSRRMRRGNAREEAHLAGRMRAVAESELFDPAWYVKRYPDLGITEAGALRHFLESGWSSGRDPNPLFHEAWYRQRNATSLAPGESGLEHYLRTRAGASAPPNPLFDPEWYLNLNPDVRAYHAGPLHHFLRLGWREGRDPHPLFDTDWFLAEYADAAQLGETVNPLAYFLDTAAVTGQSPCPMFDAEWYLSKYPDVEASGLNPLLHYLEHGAREGRDPSPAFDTKWYLENNPDVAATGMNPLIHYAAAGVHEGRLPVRRKMAVAADAAVAAARPLPAADGLFEWEDYAPLKQRIATEARQALADARIAPPPLVKVEESAVDETIARLSFPVHSAPRVSIVIPVYRKIALTLECLLSIANAPGECCFEVIVSDDGSGDGSAERLAAIPGLVIRRNEQNLGFLRNCNSAFPLARGEFVALLNNDVQVTPGWLDALVGSFSSFEKVGAVGPKIVFPTGHLQEAGVALREDGTADMVGLFDDPARERYNYARPVDYVSGACLVMRTALLRELGGFSEDFLPCYCEDSDLCMRILQRGLRIIYQPAATVVHHLSKTTADGANDVKLRSVASSMNRFVQKWQQDLDRLSAVKVLAFYLPQFHPIPENDHWWGAGFTEWSNVTRAVPNFVGHYQPRLPADLGFYDLRVPEVMEAQAALARRYGIHGFCCYYYWFAGKRLLEAPIERMLAAGKPDIPYCLCWANENWTRRWDGEDHDVLIAQKYSPRDDEAVILDLIRHFRSGNYIRIDGKPLLLVYRVTMFPDFRATAERWRRVCRREGVGDIYLAMVESFDLVHAGADPAAFNCDASVEFPPLGMAQPRPPSGAVTNPDFVGQVADYRDIAARFCARPLPAHTRFRGVMPGWDNTARRQNNSFCFEHATPGAFQAWLETAIAHTRTQYHGDERIVFLNAWNEWAEGAYLEPDRRFGHTFLEAVRNAHDAADLLRMNRYALDL